MSSPDATKPFSPTEAQRILGNLKQPAVFLDMTPDWPVRQWTAERLTGSLGGKTIRFRLGRKDETHAPLFETQCSYLEANLEQFLGWTSGCSGADVGAFSHYPHSEYWAYADYKYIALLFQETPSMFQDVKWSDFGFEGRNGKESTLWIGTQGANTPCHLDSYGCNLVLQVQGRKRWHLFPPEDTANMYPTRIPYEESSIFSQVDVVYPNLGRFPAFRGARAHSVTLLPGQVLFVPRHWWHYVESVDPLTVSVNSWIEMEVDDEARVGEAVTKAVVCAMKMTPSDNSDDQWLNPTEEGVSSHDENMQWLNLAVQAFIQKQRSSRCRDGAASPRASHPAKRLKKSAGDAQMPSTVSFGPHLIPVTETQVEHLPDHTEALPGNCTGCTVSPIPNPDQCSVALQADGTSEEEREEPEHTSITTNDLLECLLHPHVISRVTQLLLEKQNRTQMTTQASL